MPRCDKVKKGRAAAAAAAAVRKGNMNQFRIIKTQTACKNPAAASAVAAGGSQEPQCVLELDERERVGRQLDR